MRSKSLIVLVVIVMVVVISFVLCVTRNKEIMVTPVIVSKEVRDVRSFYTVEEKIIFFWKEYDILEVCLPTKRVNRTSPLTPSPLTSIFIFLSLRTWGFVFLSLLLKWEFLGCLMSHLFSWHPTVGILLRHLRLCVVGWRYHSL